MYLVKSSGYTSLPHKNNVKVPQRQEPRQGTTMIDATKTNNFKGWYSTLGVFIVDYQSRIMGMSLGHRGKVDYLTIVIIIYID